MHNLSLQDWGPAGGKWFVHTCCSCMWRHTNNNYRSRFKPVPLTIVKSKKVNGGYVPSRSFLLLRGPYWLHGKQARAVGYIAYIKLVSLLLCWPRAHVAPQLELGCVGPPLQVRVLSAYVFHGFPRLHESHTPMVATKLGAPSRERNREAMLTMPRRMTLVEVVCNWIHDDTPALTSIALVVSGTLLWASFSLATGACPLQLWPYFCSSWQSQLQL